MLKGARLAYKHLVTKRDRPALPNTLAACLSAIWQKDLVPCRTRLGGNMTDPFHTSKPSAPINHPMRPTLIPRACSLDESVQGWDQAFIHRLGTRGFLPI